MPLVAFAREPIFGEVGQVVKVRSSCRSWRISVRILADLQANSMMASWSSASEHQGINELMRDIKKWLPTKESGHVSFHETIPSCKHLGLDIVVSDEQCI